MAANAILNQTLQQSGQSGLFGLTFDQAYAVTSSVPFIVALGIVWFLPLLIYVIWGATASARTSDGRKLQSKVISNANFWIGFVIWAFLQLALFLMIIFPVWLRIFE